ncbi:hypothetical protein JTE90_014209 [Oedothorax gibbosus]|uniref:Peroxidase n=1 Tax=Oedothorax gibbosus TaxID=931172 RepID=A0AAV6U3U6_9ARAC|nr:hypothetical protein JTE90_014209 [Oedothorax gibbosus]
MFWKSSLPNALKIVLFFFVTKTSADVETSTLSSDAVEEALLLADVALEEWKKKEFERQRIDRDFVDDDIAGIRHDYLLPCGSKSRYLESVQQRYEVASKLLIHSFDLSSDQVRSSVGGIEPRSRGRDLCSRSFNATCDPDSKYRTYDGSCNNLRNPLWGAAPSCYLRLVDPDYGDGISEKRRSTSGGPLPSPRTVSVKLHGELAQTIPNVTAMLTIWGQFLGHDLLLTPVTKGPKGEMLRCCPVRKNNHPQCDPIIIEPGDPFFAQFNVTCLHNVRSAACGTCALGPRQQVDEETVFIDASQLYGPNENISRSLRKFDGTGNLRFIKSKDGGELLSLSNNPKRDFCSFQNPKLDCFRSGKYIFFIRVSTFALTAKIKKEKLTFVDNWCSIDQKVG